MDLTRLSILLIMFTPMLLAVVVLFRVLDWRGAVRALHLRWEREQRQAGATGISLPQRQQVQATFEELVSSRPMIPIWIALTTLLGCGAFAVALAWNRDDLRWSGLWLVAPVVVFAASLTFYGWMLVRAGHQQLTSVSSSLYGPPPPRVKIRNIQVDESDVQE